MSTFKWIIVWISIFIASIVIAEVALDVIVVNNVSMDAEIQELQGIQGARVASQKSKQSTARRQSKPEIEKQLAQIVEEQKPQYVIINGALELQQKLAAAEKAKDYNVAAALSSELEGSIPKAKAALKVLADLLEQEIKAIIALDNDKAAIHVAKSSYNSWEVAVNSLKVEPLTFEELDQRRNVILTEGSSAIATSRQIVQSVKQDEFNPEEKKVLDEEVVEKGQKVVFSLGDILKSIPQQIFGALESLNFISNAMNAYGGSSGGMMQMLDDMQFGQGFFAKSKMSDFEKKIDMITGGVSLYLKQFKPFLSTVGNRAGRGDVAGIENTPIIRFGDPKGRYIIAEDNDDYRLSIDTISVRRNPSNPEDILFMYCYEFTETGAKKLMSSITREAARILDGTRYIYTFAELKPGAVKIIPGATSYQRSDFSEVIRSHELNKSVETIKNNSDEAKLVEILKYIVPYDPKYQMLHDMQPGARNYVIRDGSGKRNSSGGIQDISSPRSTTPQRQQQSNPQTKTQATTENDDAVISSYNTEAITIAAIQQERGSALKNFEAGKYALAYRQFVRAAKMFDGNYVDAYWAAFSAMKDNNKEASKEWLSICLKIKPDYSPALQLQKQIK